MQRMLTSSSVAWTVSQSQAPAPASRPDPGAQAEPKGKETCLSGPLPARRTPPAPVLLPGPLGDAGGGLSGRARLVLPRGPGKGSEAQKKPKEASIFRRPTKHSNNGRHRPRTSDSFYFNRHRLGFPHDSLVRRGIPASLQEPL